MTEVGIGSAEIARVRLKESAAPGTPASGYGYVYARAGGLYYKGDDGVEIGPIGASSANVDLEGRAGAALSERDYVYLGLSDGEWYKVDIDASPVALSPVRGFVVESGGILENATGTIRVAGVLGGFTALTAGALVYAHTTAGGYTQTRPTVTDGGTQKAICVAGQAISTTEVLIIPRHVEYAKRDTLANNATLTIEHHADAEVMTREVLATILSSEEGASLTSYADTNRDDNVYLEGPTGAGGATDINTSAVAIVIGDSTGNDRWVAQTLQATAGFLSQISIDLTSNAGTPTGTMTWQICTDGGTGPGTVLATGTFTPTASQENIITMSGDNKVYLAASTTYWLVFGSTTAQGSGNAWRTSRSASSIYASGTYWYSDNGGSSYTQASSYDVACSLTTAAAVEKEKLSQSFQIASGGNVGSVKLYLKKVGTPTGTLTLRIETNNAGNPSGTLVDVAATATVAESTLSTSYGWITFTFSTVFALSATTTYHIVLDTDRATSNTNYVVWGADASSPGYADGDMRYYASAAWAEESKDAIFSVISENATYQEPCAMGRWSGGTRDAAVRYDDGSAADPTTKTTVKNVSGAEVDMTVIVRLP